MTDTLKPTVSPLQLRDEFETMVLKELLGPGFHEAKHGVRYTISETARREVLARLLKLNHERYAEEVKQGLHEKKKGRGARGKGRAKKNAEPDESGGLFE